MGSPISLILIVIVFGGMMFFMNRQQKKQQQQRQNQLNAMQTGSEITTIGGLHGILSSIDEAKGTIELDCEGVILTFDRAAVKTVKNPAAPETVGKVESVVESPIEEN
ncbi:preprotein translocase subunit YajC [Lactococcus hircilactis]|uniref:Preprotein translocase subunit YajC n=1 Tax=Lactococcus hircilactis TaxID=1494462 RepID=A0A7X1ZAI8_9LACT|nr:preprotein translocase subunit YajC [Lactococcus hircilactis]MQW40294.1 preprotein translocase subunit YajC [Lactococcus hircilactis]